MSDRDNMEWTKSESNILLRKHQSGSKLEEISKAHRRSITSVYQKLIDSGVDVDASVKVQGQEVSDEICRYMQEQELAQWDDYEPPDEYFTSPPLRDEETEDDGFDELKSDEVSRFRTVEYDLNADDLDGYDWEDYMGGFDDRDE